MKKRKKRGLATPKGHLNYSICPFIVSWNLWNLLEGEPIFPLNNPFCPRGGASGANFSYHFEFHKVKRISKRKIARQKRLESYVNPIKRAREYQRIMLNQRLTQSQLAIKLGISRVRVNQYLARLKLPEKRQGEILK